MNVEQLIIAGKASKAAASAPAKKAAAPAKAAAKPAAKGKATAKAPASPFKYRIITGRPASGAALQAFTAAWMEMAGLMAGKAAEKRVLAYVAGDTAISFHVKNGRFQLKDGKVSLTAGGREHFKAREIDADEKKAWINILKTGKADGQRIKNQHCIDAIPA